MPPKTLKSQKEKNNIYKGIILYYYNIQVPGMVLRDNAGLPIHSLKITGGKYEKCNSFC